TEEGKSIKSASGKIVGTASIKYEYKGQAYVSAVPVVYGVSVGGGVEGTIELKIDSPLDPENIRKSLEGSIVLTHELGITGGVGIVNIAELSATGKASLPIEIHTHENYHKVEFTAEAELNLYLGTFNIAKATTPKYTKKIYETAVATPYSFDEHESIYDKIDLNAPLTPMDRAYAARSSVWQGENSVKLYSDNALDVLQTNIYPEAHPIITEADGKKIIMWTADDTARDEYNRSVLVYSVYDESTGTWSAPTAVYDDGNLDLAPEIQNGYVVWQKANRKITSSDSLTDLSKSFDIYVAKFNGTGFDAPTRLTDDSELDSQPSIDVIDGKAVVVWSKNTESDIFGTNGVNSIMLSEFTNGTWSAPTALASGLNAIDSVSVGYMNDRPVTVCSIDTDNSIETTDDRELFVIENGDITQFTNDDVIDTKPQFVDLNNKNTLFWYSNGEIAYVNTFDDPVFSAIPVNTGTDDVRIASDGNKAAVFYTVPDDNGSEVYASLFDGVQWSQGIQLTETDGRTLYPSGIFDKNGTIITAFNRISENGQADLCTVKLTPACDIEIGELYAGTFKPNSEVPVLFNIKNTGEKPVDTIKIELIDSEGNVNYTETVKETLQPG
ncbi:MAG: hypothetical protein IJ736_03850, partial [Firmicutes bacterium]|nr:hypothetical protein [Bacillota bacterium]